MEEFWNPKGEIFMLCGQQQLVRNCANSFSTLSKINIFLFSHRNYTFPADDALLLVSVYFSLLSFIHFFPHFYILYRSPQKKMLINNRILIGQATWALAHLIHYWIIVASTTTTTMETLEIYFPPHVVILRMIRAHKLQRASKGKRDARNFVRWK